MNGWTKRLAGGVLLLTHVVASGNGPALGQAREPKSWPEVKCDRYKLAWSEVRTRWGIRSLGKPFLDSHAAFLASGCTARADVCPRSAEEFEIANVLTIAAMNAGMASTFLPFACRN